MAQIKLVVRIDTCRLFVLHYYVIHHLITQYPNIQIYYALDLVCASKKT
jgi:hypothetical protein